MHETRAKALAHIISAALVCSCDVGGDITADPMNSGPLPVNSVASPDCHDEDAAWWSGLHRIGGPHEPVPVTFKITNSTAQSLYVETIIGRELNFSMYAETVGAKRRLSLAANQYCASKCPDVGLPMERDCEPPTPVLRRLPSGDSLAFTWSGEELVPVNRTCGQERGYCWHTRSTAPGAYIVEVCGFRDANGGRAVKDDADYLMLATPIGDAWCERAEFEYPASDVVDLVYDDPPE